MVYRLERPSTKHKERAFELLKPYMEVDGGIEASTGLDCFLMDDDYEGWLKNLEDQLYLPDPEYVPHETLFFMEGERIVGIVNIRHELPKRYNWVGHVGYSIHPQERRKGKGTILLKLAINRCHELGIEPVMVSLAEHNIASEKLVEKCGGVFLNVVELNGEVFKRYLI